MNLKLLKQLNKDSNGKVISLLACFISEGLELCFYTKGIMPGTLGIDDLPKNIKVVKKSKSFDKLTNSSYENSQKLKNNSVRKLKKNFQPLSK